MNKYRATTSAVFAYAQKPTTFALGANPAKATDRRREAQRPALDTYTVAEVEQLAQALEDGRHRDPARPASSDADHAEDRQDAELYVWPPIRGCAKGSCGPCAGAMWARKC